MEYPQVAVDVCAPILAGRLWQPIAALFIVPEASVQRFLLAQHKGDHLIESRQLQRSYGPLTSADADYIAQMASDVVYTSLARSVGIQTDLGVHTG